MSDDRDILERLDDAYESLSDIGGAYEREVVTDAIIEIKRLRMELLVFQVGPPGTAEVEDMLSESISATETLLKNLQGMMDILTITAIVNRKE